ncbi:MAG: nucleotidyltransferase family protein [Leptospirales bacterium]
MIANINETIMKYLKHEGAEKVGLFGSYSSGNFTSSSDIDVLVRFKAPKGLFELSRIQRELSENTGYPIDLVTEKSISPYLADELEKSMVVLYEEK